MTPIAWKRNHTIFVTSLYCFKACPCSLLFYSRQSPPTHVCAFWFPTGSGSRMNDIELQCTFLNSKCNVICSVFSRNKRTFRILLHPRLYDIAVLYRKPETEKMYFSLIIPMKSCGLGKMFSLLRALFSSKNYLCKNEI